VNNTASGAVYTFTQGGEPPAPIVFNVSSFGETEIWTFFLKFCDRVDSMYGDYREFPAAQWMGWNHGYMSEFKVGTPGGWDYLQRYSVGDAGYNCPTGRNSTVYLYCNRCPSGSSCQYGNSTYCVCSASYNRETSPCSAVLFISVACPAPYYPPAPVPLPGTPAGEIVGILFFILFVLGAVGCAGGYIYNYKVYNRRGKEAIPGYRMITKGQERFSGVTYQRTAPDSNSTGASYGSL